MTLTEEIESLKESIKWSLEALEEEDLTIDSIEGYIKKAYNNLNTITRLLKKMNEQCSNRMALSNSRL